MEFVDDPREIEEARTSFAHFGRNLKWYEAHSKEVFARGAGRHICIAGEELFVADTVKEVLALAKAAHPEDKGVFCEFVRAEKNPKIYAYRRPVASV